MFEKIKRLTGHVLVYGFGNIGNRIVGFLLIPVYSRYLTPEDYGVLALVAMLGQILYAVMNMGQNSALFRTYFRHESADERETVVTTSLWLILTLSLPIGLLALALSKPISSLLVGSPAYTVWVALAILGVVFKVFLRLPLADHARPRAIATATPCRASCRPSSGWRSPSSSWSASTLAGAGCS